MQSLYYELGWGQVPQPNFYNCIGACELRMRKIS